MRSWSQMCTHACVLLALALTGCAGTRIRSARAQFYASRFAEAEATLSEPTEADEDNVLLLLERGTIRQAMGQYEASTADWLRAVEIVAALETRSATEHGASLLVNDKTISFRGAPFERTLLRTFLAKNYLMRGMAEDAAVEARNIVENLQDLKGYPDDAYSRYMAGFCLELFRDPSNAALQYKNASALLQGFTVDEKTGVISVAVDKKNAKPKAKQTATTHELVCFVLIGRSPSPPQLHTPVAGPAPRAEIYVRSKYLGRSYPLADVAVLMQKTEKKEALRQVGKDALRLGTKLAVAHQVKQQDELLGNLLEFALLAMDSPDDRRWGGLPRWLQVARLPCPPDVKSFDVRFKDAGGRVFYEASITAPIAQFGNIYVSFCRNLPPSPIPTASDMPSH